MMPTVGRRGSHDSLFSGKWRLWNLLARDRGHGSGGGGRGGSDRGGNGRGDGDSGNHNRDDNDNSNGEGRGRASGGTGNSNGGSGSNGNDNSNGNGSGRGSSSNDNDNSGGSSNGNGSGNNNDDDTTTKTQKKTTTARSTTKSPSRATSTTKAKEAATTTTTKAAAASPDKTHQAQNENTEKAQPSTTTSSPKAKSPTTTSAAEVPATRQTEQATSVDSTSDSSSETTEVPVPITAASSDRARLPSSATPVVGSPGSSTSTASTQSPVPGVGGHGNSTNVGGIVAGVVVGILALLVLAFLGWKFRRSKQLAPIFGRFRKAGDDEGRQVMNSSPSMGESLLIGAGAMARGQGDGNVSPPAYEETRSRMEAAALPLAKPSPAVTRSASHRAQYSDGATQAVSQPAGSTDFPRPVPSMTETSTRIPISLIPGPMRLRRATSPNSGPRGVPYQNGSAHGAEGLARKPVPNRHANNLPVPPPEPRRRESSDTGDRRTTNHSGWSSWLPPTADMTDRNPRHRDSFSSVGGVSIASSGVISPSVLNWPMPPSTPPTMSVTGLSEDGRQSAQSRGRPGEPTAMRQVYQAQASVAPPGSNRGPTPRGPVNDGAEVLTASRITFQQPSRTVVRVQRRSTQSSVPSSEWSETRQPRGR